ncbi:MAG: hypothetical protein F4Z01_04795 [Gammaproteobacteria bacterium]|nr:hypothetical protein [Gammaproteobacteria bacterium]MYF38290.1 hypothetical protein [Gammaproteobacteria bacterium]
MKSKLLMAVSALSLVLALPLLAQGQGGGQWGGGQGGSVDMSQWQKQWVERAVGDTDKDDDGELSKEEFLEMAANERYSTWFEEDESEDEESEDEEAESEEADEATTDESEEGEEESEEDAHTKMLEAKFAEMDADDDGNLTVDELYDSIDFEAVRERMMERWQQGGGNRQRGQGQGGGNWQRPGGGSP